MNLLNFIDTYPFSTGLILGTVCLVFRLLRPLILRFDFVGTPYFHYAIVKKIFEADHTVVMYEVSSNGHKSVIDEEKSQRVFIEDPLRVEDDVMFSKVTPHIYFDPKTLKIKGYFHLLSPNMAKDKYYETVYEGQLVLIEHIPAYNEISKVEEK